MRKNHWICGFIRNTLIRNNYVVEFSKNGHYIFQIWRTKKRKNAYQHFLDLNEEQNTGGKMILFLKKFYHFGEN